MSDERRRQKKLEKKKKDRQLVKAKQQRAELAKPQGSAQLVAQGAGGPFGPCFISENWQATMTPPPLVTLIITRVLPDGLLLPAVALVDRTCLGVKSAFAMRPCSSMALDDYIARIDDELGGLAECEPLLAQSIVFHAIDYAARFGFSPDADFPAPLFGPRPEQLLDTPLANLERPLFVSGPNDNAQIIIKQLERTAGPGNFDVMAAL